MPPRRVGADPFPYLLLVDEERRPIGWVADDRLPASGPLGGDLATGTSPLFDRRTTLKDALAMLIQAEVQAGIVVDERGAVVGLVTADDITTGARREDGT
jgi:osmoprotectant transport system ATP-binding protein